MKLHSSLHKDFRKKEELIAKNGDVKFNNHKSKIDAKGKTKSSQQWLHRQVNDPFSNAAKIEGYLARSAYKLLEIQHKYHIFTEKTKIVIDLGCSPGSWSQVVLTNKQFAGKKVIGIDLLPIKFQHKDLSFIQGDFEDKNTQKQLVEKINEISKKLDRQNNKQTSAKNENLKVDCVICDIALNNVGDAEIDRLRSERIIELAFSFCQKHLANEGNFVCKAIKGADNAVFNNIKKCFSKTFRFKPKSSHKDSSEIFIVALNKL